MDKDKVLEIARECGIRVHTTGSPMVAINCYTALESEMLKFADAISASTREECAELCERVNSDTSECPELALYCAEAISNMGKEG